MQQKFPIKDSEDVEVIQTGGDVHYHEAENQGRGRATYVQKTRTKRKNRVRKDKKDGKR